MLHVICRLFILFSSPVLLSWIFHWIFILIYTFPLWLGWFAYLMFMILHMIFSKNKNYFNHFSSIFTFDSLFYFILFILFSYSFVDYKRIRSYIQMYPHNEITNRIENKLVIFSYPWISVCVWVCCYQNIFDAQWRALFFFLQQNGMEIVETQLVLCIFITFGMDQEHYLDTCYSIQKINIYKCIKMNRIYIHIL